MGFCGEAEDREVDVRIVAATHRDLTKETEAGRFREDLFYRLNVLPIALPPLRDRREDIPLLASHFLERNNARLGTEIEGIDGEARRLLYEYAWPGNVRELENTLERAVVLAESSTITPTDLPDRVRRALQKTKGNRTRAAELLEISHRALLYKIKDYLITDL